MCKYIFGVDIGGTFVKMGLFNTEGRLLEKWEMPTNKKAGGTVILREISEQILSKRVARGVHPEDIEGVGVCIPGVLDKNGMLVMEGANVKWGITDIAGELTKLVNLPVNIINDANAAALGEAWQGSGKSCADMVMVTLGTGVGSGIIIDGKILNGALGVAGEIGHFHVKDDETEVCGCGKRGCLEQYASATGIVRLAKQRLNKDNSPSTLRDGAVSAKTVFDAVKEGDEVAIEVVEQFGYYLGKGLAAMANIINPEVFVIGGGVSKAGEILLQYVEPAFHKFVVSCSGDVQFRIAELGNDAGIYGAARMVLEQK